MKFAARAGLVLAVVVAVAAPAGARVSSKPRTTPLASITEAEIRAAESDWLVADDTAVWLARGGGFVDRIDPATNAVSASVEVTSDVCQGMGTGDGAVWTCDGPNLVRLDPATASVVASIPVDKSADQGHLPVVAGHVWVITGTDPATLVGVNTTTNAPDITVPLDAWCVDATATVDAVWIACVSGEVLHVDPQTSSVGVRVPKLPLAYQTTANDDAVFVSYERGVARIDPATGKVTARAKAAINPLDSGIAADATAVWLRTEKPFLRRFDPTSLKLLERVTASTDSAGTVLVAFGSVWASSYDDAFVHRLDVDPS